MSITITSELFSEKYVHRESANEKFMENIQVG